MSTNEARRGGPLDGLSKAQLSRGLKRGAQMAAFCLSTSRLPRHPPFRGGGLEKVIC